jgi:hypothetical protein
MPWTFFRSSAFYNFKTPQRVRPDKCELPRACEKKDFCPGLVLAGPSFRMFKKAFSKPLPGGLPQFEGFKGSKAFLSWRLSWLCFLHIL